MKSDIGSCPAFAFITNSPFRQLIDRWNQCVQDHLSPAFNLACILAGQLLKFCAHAIFWNAPTLNNSQNFGSELLSLMNSGTW